MRGPAFAFVLATAVTAGCTSVAPPNPDTAAGGHPGATFDALPPLVSPGQGGAGGRAPVDARPMSALGGTGGDDAGGVAQPDAEDIAPDAAGAHDTQTPNDDASPGDARIDPPPGDASAPDAPRPGITTLTLDVSGVSPRGVLTVVGYGGFAFPFNPALAKRALATISASTIVNLASKNNITCHADAAQAIQFISSMPIANLGAATVVELRVDMPLHVPGDSYEHLPTEFCVGFRRGGAWTWQPMPIQAFLMRAAGRALLVAPIGPQPAGSPGVDALGVLAEGGAVVKAIEIDIRR